MTQLAKHPVTEVQHKLRTAGDEQLAQVVALVDAMPARGEADALIAPLRARLAALEPARPLTFTRLLFRPLDPVIVIGPRWRPGVPAVPRTALPSIGQAIIARLGPAVAPIKEMIAGHNGRERAVAADAGRALWPAAAAVLDRLPLPADWRHVTGLPESCYTEIRSNIEAVLHQAVPLRQRAQDGDATGLVHASSTAILAATQAQHPAGLGIVLAVLLADGAEAGPALLAAMAIPGAQVDSAVEQTLDRVQHVLTNVLPSSGLAAASSQAKRVAALLDAIEGPCARPMLRSQTQRTRQLADQACQGRLRQALDQDFLPKLAGPGTVLDDAEVTDLESTARGLRLLATVGRRLGGGTKYDQLLCRTAADACAVTDSTLTHMERLRLAELLVGSDAARRLMLVKQ